MAAFTEDHVSVSVRLTTNPDGTRHAYLNGSSYAADGTHLRDFPETEVTGALTPTQQQEAIDLLNAAVAYLKGQWQITP